MELTPPEALPACEATRFAVLLFSDIVGSSELKARHGMPAYTEALRTHNSHFERLVNASRDIRILQNLGDGYYAEANSATEAVRFALLFQQAMRDGPWGSVRLNARVGIHAGEVAAIEIEGGSGIVAPAADLASRVMHIAEGGQILLTRSSFDEARYYLREHPRLETKEMPPLSWLAHGYYRIKGIDEPLEVFEVGAEGLAPLAAPPDGEKARRLIRPGEEETLGWRPAIGLEIPGRAGWTLTERLGAGGFGEVWAGENARLRRRNAFKFCFDDERLSALKREVTLVRLLRSALGDRDDIVRIHELQLKTPPFYLESDLAPHGNLLQWAERQGGLGCIPLARRIALVADTATALAAAHSVGVLHKDIKPTNILIFDDSKGEPRPRLVDFGIGTLADHTVLQELGVTASGFTRATVQRSSGTPTYSPPEYSAGKPYTIQGDIFGLGVLLYQLITCKPHDPLAHGWERDITDPLLREDIADCVDGDPARRLSSAADLADRLHHLESRRADAQERERLASMAAAHRQAEASAKAARSRARRFCQLAAAFAGIALIAVASGVVARRNQQKAADALKELALKKTEVDRKSEEYRAMLAEAARSDRFVAEEKLGVGEEREAFAYLARACDYDRQSSLAAEKAVVGLATWLHPPPDAILVGHKGGVRSARFSKDGNRVVTSSGDGARIWDAATGQSLTTLKIDQGASTAQFSPDGKSVITGSMDGPAFIWDAVTGDRRMALQQRLPIARNFGGSTPHGCSEMEACFSSDGSHVIVSSMGPPRVWETSTGYEVAGPIGHSMSAYRTRFSPDGSRLITASEETARVWDFSGQQMAVLGAHRDVVVDARFSPDGKLIATASWDRTAVIHDAVTGQRLASLAGHDGAVISASFSDDSTRVVTASGDGTAIVWNVATGKSLVRLIGHKAGLRNAEFNSDGTKILTASDDATVRIWSDSGKTLAILSGHDGDFGPDGKRIITESGDGAARIWDIKKIVSPPPHSVLPSPDLEKFFSPDGSRVLTLTVNRTAQIWDSATGDLLCALPENSPDYILFSHDGKRVATQTLDDALTRVWDATTGRCLLTLVCARPGPDSLRFSPDGFRILTSAPGDTVQLWDLTTGREIGVPVEHSSVVGFAEFSPDSTRFITFSNENTARIWDGTTGLSLGALNGHAGRVRTAQFSGDSTRIVTSSYDKTARVWDAKTNLCLATITGEEGKGIHSVLFNPDSTRILALSGGGTARILDGYSGASYAMLAGYMGGRTTDEVTAKFSFDGKKILTSSEGLTTVWDAASGKAIATLGKGWLQNSIAFTQDGARIITTGDKAIQTWDLLSGELVGTLKTHETTVPHARMDSRILLLSRAPSIYHFSRFSEVFPPHAGPPPEWFADFLRYVAQGHLNSTGEFETLKPGDWMALRKKMNKIRQASMGQETPYLRMLSRFVSE